ncbi:unnamed protein product [Chrysoparadoxa australica]
MTAPPLPRASTSPPPLPLKERRSVIFADELGLELATVRLSDLHHPRCLRGFGLELAEGRGKPWLRRVEKELCKGVRARLTESKKWPLQRRKQVVLHSEGRGTELCWINMSTLKVTKVPSERIISVVEHRPKPRGGRRHKWPDTIKALRGDVQLPNMVLTYLAVCGKTKRIKVEVEAEPSDFTIGMD